MTRISSPLYDKLKFSATLALPAIGTLVFVLVEAMGLKEADLVLGAFIVVIFLLGVALFVSCKAFYSSDARFDGQMDVQQVGDKKVVQMAFTDEHQLRTLTDKREVRFKVNQLDESE